MRRTWSTINEALNKIKKKDAFPNHFKVDGIKTDSKTDIANSFNSFFANIGKNLSEKIHCATSNTIDTYLKQNIICSFKFQCVEATDVLNIISDLAPKNSCGVDNISSKLLQRISIITAAPLAHIINQSLCTGIFPDRLKIARVMPLYKKDDPHLVDNYRPISVLPAISKVFERVVFNQLYDYMHKNKLLYVTVDCDGTFSTLTNLTTGVPQGSILGPLLFIIYMNDIHEASENFHAILYADDTSLLSSLGSFNVALNGTKFDKYALSQSINTELNNIQEWLNINKLSLNVNKTKYMIFHYHQRNIDDLIPDIRLNNQAIERVSEFNFLGLTIDQHLSWNAHVQKISNRVGKLIGILNRLKRYLSTDILRTLYSALILPHFQFSVLNWGFKANRIVKLQKRAIRVITNN